MDFNGRLMKLWLLLRVIILLLYTSHVHRGAMSQLAFAGTDRGAMALTNRIFNQILRQIHDENGASALAFSNGQHGTGSTMTSRSGPGGTSSSSTMVSNNGASSVSMIQGGPGSSYSSMVSNNGVSGISMINGVINCGGQICPEGSTQCHLDIRSVDNDQNIRKQQICYKFGAVTGSYENIEPNPNPGSRVYMSSSSGGSWF